MGLTGWLTGCSRNRLPFLLPASRFYFKEPFNKVVPFFVLTLLYYLFVMLSLSEVFLLVITLYLLYRFFFNFLLPVVRTTRQVREQFRNMQNPGNNPGGPFQRSYTNPNSSRPEEPQPKKTEPRTSSNTMGEYIDFEEVK